MAKDKLTEEHGVKNGWAHEFTTKSCRAERDKRQPGKQRLWWVGAEVGGAGLKRSCWRHKQVEKNSSKV